MGEKVLVIGKRNKVPGKYHWVQQVGSDLYDLTFGPERLLHEYDFVIHQPTFRAGEMPGQRKGWEELYDHYGVFLRQIPRDHFDHHGSYVGAGGDCSDLARLLESLYMRRLLEIAQATPAGLRTVILTPPSAHRIDTDYVFGWACRQLLCKPGPSERNTVQETACLGAIMPVLLGVQYSDWTERFTFRWFQDPDEVLPDWCQPTSWGTLIAERPRTLFEIDNSFLQTEVKILPVVRNRRGEAKAVLFKSGEGWILLMPQICDLQTLLEAISKDLDVGRPPAPDITFRFTGKRSKKAWSREPSRDGIPNKGWEVEKMGGKRPLRVSRRPSELLLCFVAAARHHPGSLDVSNPVVAGQPLGTVFFQESGKPYKDSGKAKSTIEEALRVKDLIKKCVRDPLDTYYRLNTSKYAVDTSRFPLELAAAEREKYSPLLNLIGPDSGH